MKKTIDERQQMCETIKRSGYNKIRKRRLEEISRFDEKYVMLRSIKASTTSGHSETFLARNNLTGMLVSVKKINKSKLNRLSKVQ